MSTSDYPALDELNAIQTAFEAAGYICTTRIATVIKLAAALEKPVLIEGPPGVGKTELAKTCAQVVNRPLVRLQCYEGLDESKALYEWKYGKQLLYTQLLKEQLGDILDGAKGLSESMDRLHQFGDVFYSEAFLEPRPLLKAMGAKAGSVLLIDEIDKADFEFESLLLEVLSDFQVSVPELGTINAESKPLVFLTSNDTRDLSDALKRRCLHLHIPFPTVELEARIVASRVPDLSQSLTDQLVRFVHAVRALDLKKAPAISETIDWAKSLILLHAKDLEGSLVLDTLNVLLKYEEDIKIAEGQLPKLMASAAA
ncbi:MAG: AAA family ATPase [Luminiphilus sp.]